MKFSVQFTDDTTELVTVLPVDIVAAERKFKMGVAEMDSSIYMEHALFLAWSACRRTQQRPSEAFDAFILTVAEIELAKGEDADPLPTPSDS